MDIDQVESLVREDRHLCQRVHDLETVLEDLKACGSKDFFRRSGADDVWHVLKQSKELREAFAVEVNREVSAAKVDLKVLAERMADWK